MSNPIWIILDDGDTFEGHQGHFADSFFSNATEEDIRGFAAAHWMKCEIRAMTNEEMQKYPEAVWY